MDDLFDTFKQQVRDRVEEYLADSLDAQPVSEVQKAAQYAALAGGHRWRALVAVAAGRVFRDNALELVVPSAAGVELAHAASLILDDLPSMDDAKMRRGKPCVHLVFPRWVTDMVPVYLVTLAYQVSLQNELVSFERRVRCALELSRAGLGMIQGQELDLAQNGSRPDSEDYLRTCYELKTGVLFAAAAKAGAVLCGASDAEADLFGRCGMSLGVSFQYQDDIADKIAAFDQIGKDAHKDDGKLTSVGLFGVRGAQTQANDMEKTTLFDLERYGDDADLLRRLVSGASWEAS